MLGAGDAFSAGFLSGWVRGEDYDALRRYANACGALVVSRHGCAPAMPTRVELDYFLANADAHSAAGPGRDADAPAPRHRAARAARRGVRVRLRSSQPVLRAGAAKRAPTSRALPQLKRLLVDAVAETEAALRARAAGSGILCDDRYGQDALNAATGRGWWIGRPVELPGSNPLQFDRGRSIGTHAASRWPREHVVKCLVQYHPDDADRASASSRRRRSARSTTRCRRAATSCCSRSFRRSRAAARAGHRAARAEAPLQPRHLSRVVEARADVAPRSGRRSTR